MQYAGASLGSIWFLLQGLLILGLYIFVSERFLARGADFSHVLTGVLFWIPFSEMMQKSTVVLTENRAIIKRSGIGIDLFYWIPIVQMLFHFLLLSIPALTFLFWKGKLSYSFFIVFPFIIFLAIVLFPISRYLAMANVLLKDISPIIRLFLQIIFWTLPIVYVSPESIYSYLKFNPLFPCIQIFRSILLSGYEFYDILDLSNIIIINILIYIITNYNLKKQIADHI